MFRKTTLDGADIFSRSEKTVKSKPTSEGRRGRILPLPAREAPQFSFVRRRVVDTHKITAAFAAAATAAADGGGYEKGVIPRYEKACVKAGIGVPSSPGSFGIVQGGGEEAKRRQPIAGGGRRRVLDCEKKAFQNAGVDGLLSPRSRQIRGGERGRQPVSGRVAGTVRRRSEGGAARGKEGRGSSGNRLVDGAESEEEMKRTDRLDVLRWMEGLGVKVF